MSVVIRKACPTDRPFVLSSWMKSYRGARYFDGWDNVRFYSDYNGFQERIKGLLNRIETRLVVAHFAGDPDEILGWAAGEPPSSLFYVYVKQPYRNANTPRGEDPLRVSEQLIKAICPKFGTVETQCACTCPGWGDLRKRFLLQFNPYL